MRTTESLAPRWDVLRPRSIGIFVVMAAAWVVIALLPDWDAVWLRAAARLAGYIAFIAMLVPYLHIVRRCFRERPGRPMRTWLRWHIVAAYVAFLMVLIHSRGRANGISTTVLIWLTWIVMVSGVLGYYGQKLLYFMLPRIVKCEVGLERAEPQRAALLQAAEELLKKKEMQAVPEVIQSFGTAAVQRCLGQPLTVWHWLWTRRAADDVLSENWHRRAFSYADAKQQPIVQELWELIKARRALDLEYRLHQLGRAWLLVHGPAAWALLVLMIEHAAMSMWYGGF